MHGGINDWKKFDWINYETKERKNKEKHDERKL